MPGVGKSTAARRVARRYDLWFHAIDARTFAHAEAMNVPALQLAPDELWLGRTPEQMADEFEDEARRRSPLILADAEALPDDGAPALIEGPQVRPELVAGPAVFIAAAPPLQKALLRSRGSLTYSATSDPERALANRLARDELLADRLRARVTVVEVRRVEETEELVDAFVRENASEWLARDDHGDVAVRRRHANDRHLDQWRRYAAVEPRAREGTQQLACECDRPGCMKLVAVTLDTAERRPLRAH